MNIEQIIPAIFLIAVSNISVSSFLGKLIQN